jgi:hypothetical protein
MYTCTYMYIFIYIYMDIYTYTYKGIVNKSIFDPLLAGFADSNSKMREETLKCLVHVVDKLDEKNLQEKLVRCIGEIFVYIYFHICMCTCIYLYICACINVYMNTYI